MSFPSISIVSFPTRKRKRRPGLGTRLTPEGVSTRNVFFVSSTTRPSRPVSTRTKRPMSSKRATSLTPSLELRVEAHLLEHLLDLRLVVPLQLDGPVLRGPAAGASALELRT